MKLGKQFNSNLDKQDLQVVLGKEEVIKAGKKDSPDGGLKSQADYLPKDHGATGYLGIMPPDSTLVSTWKDRNDLLHSSPLDVPDGKDLAPLDVYLSFLFH